MSNVLVGKGTEGDFVKQTQGTAVAEGFSCVSRYWYPKTHDYSFGLEEIEKGIKSREDIVAPLSEVSAMVNDGGKVALAFADGREFVPNAHALKQLATRIGVPQTSVKHLTECWKELDDAAILRTLLNRGLQRFNRDTSNPDSHKFIFRTYNDNSMRAVLTDSFTAIDNRWYLELLSKAIPGGRLSHWRGDSDEVFGNILIPDSIRKEDDSDYGGMISIGNSEIGTGRLEQYPSLFRAICMNGCIWNQTKGTEINQVHRGKIDLEILGRRIVKNLNDQIPILDKIIDQVLSLRMNDFSLGEAKVPQVYACLGQRFGLTPKQARCSNEQFVKHESANRNLFGIMQGLTRQSQEEKNQDWVAIDKIAGKISQWDVDSWTNFISQAKLFNETQVSEALGLAV